MAVATAAVSWSAAGSAIAVASPQGATGAGVALSRTPRRQVMAMSANGLALASLFMALQAPDVALAELAVGGAVLPVLFLVVLASVRMDRTPRDGE